jgi:hypothetical protein
MRSSLNKLKIIIVVLLVVVLVGLGVTFLLEGKVKLNKTVGNLLSNVLNVEYKINKVSKGESITDISAELKLTINERGDVLKNSSDIFQLSDDADKNYFIGVIRKNLGEMNNLDKYILYRAEMPLGQDTICEISPCNIYLLKKDGGDTVYIGIYKN